MQKTPDSAWQWNHELPQPKACVNWITFAGPVPGKVSKSNRIPRSICLTTQNLAPLKRRRMREEESLLLAKPLTDTDHWHCVMSFHRQTDSLCNLMSFSRIPPKKVRKCARLIGMYETQKQFLVWFAAQISAVVTSDLFVFFCFCVCFCLYGPFNCILFHRFSQQTFAFSLCSAGLFLPHWSFQLYISLWKSPSALI